MREVLLNGRWPLILPEHRAARPEWATGWETERLASMHANLLPGDVVVDVGTEEGDISALLASWVIQTETFGHVDGTGAVLETFEHRSPDQDGGVFLVEPNERVWPNVKAIWEANGLPDPLGTFVGFCGDIVHRHAHSPNHREGWSGWPACADGPVIGDHGFCNLWERPDIDSIPLSALVGDRKVDAITMDTEGSELIVLRGARFTLEKDRPLVWVSVHPQFSVDMYDLTREDLLRFMWELDYRSEILAVDHEEHWLFWPDEGSAPEHWHDL